MRKYLKISIVIIVILALAIGASYVFEEKKRISEQFAANLFNYPLPPHTKVKEQNYFYGYSFGHLLGSGGSLPVVASMKLTSKLSEKEIIAYYNNHPYFPYPKSNSRGVELEIYFSGNYKKHNTKDGFCYSNKDEHLSRLSAYKKEQELSAPQEGNSEYILQISSSFSYILQLDR